MSYGNGYGNNRGGYGNRGGGGGNPSGGYNNRPQGNFQPKDGDVYLNPETNPKGPTSPAYWGTGTFNGQEVRIAMWHGKKPNSFKIAISNKQPSQGGGQQGGGYQNQQQGQQQQQGMYNNGPDLNDEVPF